MPVIRVKLGRKGSGISVAHKNGRLEFYVLAKPFLEDKSKELPRISPLWGNRPVFKWLKHKAGDAKNTEAPQAAHGQAQSGRTP